MTSELVELAYLGASVLFVLALKGLGHPRTAVKGNLLGAVGMLVAVAVTLAHSRLVRPELLVAGLVLGGLAGVALAAKVEMTAMPELVALLNGLGGGASALVAGSSLVTTAVNPVPSVVSALVGTVTFSGSVVATAKLRGRLESRGRGPIRRAVGILLAGATVAAAALLLREPDRLPLLLSFVGLALGLGVALVIPIGGANMPVVVAFLNAGSGLAAAATGFVLMNQALIIAGSLVGASGFILTRIMCRAMNRSLGDVLFRGAPEARAGDAATRESRPVKSASPEEIAVMLEAALRVVVIPGYGMAVAQAQHALAALTTRLKERGTDVTFAIHPVAGRMPGHMNVLLAEANVPYEQLQDLESVNPTLVEADVALLVGANDVVNPSARSDRDSPIYGMPILDADRAKSVVILKRSLSAGFAGVDNPLFRAENAVMLFGDAKASLLAINANLEGP